jgi:hypothetical protein
VAKKTPPYNNLYLLPPTLLYPLDVYTTTTCDSITLVGDLLTGDVGVAAVICKNIARGHVGFRVDSVETELGITANCSGYQLSRSPGL